MTILSGWDQAWLGWDLGEYKNVKFFNFEIRPIYVFSDLCFLVGQHFWRPDKFAKKMFHSLKSYWQVI